ncbi:MAG: hypothetical protein WCD81_07630 [Candidatus Bathyarchaeia archaeon]
MSRNRIRVQYSGLIIFVAQMLSVITGLIFILLLTRSMSNDQYGVWSNIFDLTGYFLLLSGLFPFWATRFVARGNEGSAKTGFYANLLVSLASIVIYVPLVPLLMSKFNVSGTYLMVYVVASVYIVAIYLITILEAILRAEKPQATGYGLLIEEICKISLAYLLIVRFQFFGPVNQFFGAMISLVVATSIQVIYYLKLVLRDLKQRIQWSYVREWLKGSVGYIYNAVGVQIAGFIFLLLFIYGGEAARGDYQAAATFAGIVGYSSSLAFALYPKLLAEDSLKDVTSSLRTVLMFAIPMAAVAMSMSKSLLTVLKGSYADSSLVLFLLAIDAVIVLISQFYTSVLLGIEKLDQGAKIPLKQFLRSKMFKVFTLPYIQAAIALPAGLYVLTQLATGNPLQAAIYVTIINMGAHVAAILVLYMITLGAVTIVVPWRNIGKYVFASAIMVTVLYLLPHPTTILPTLGTVVVAGAIYAALLLAIDREARIFVNSIWEEIKKSWKQFFGGEATT